MLTVSETPGQLVRNATAEAEVIAACWQECLELGDSDATAKITGLALAWAVTTALGQLQQLASQG